MFEKASRLALRFKSSKGSLTVEDLWNLPLESKQGDSLDRVAIGINKEIKELGEQSFVSEKPLANGVLDLQLDIVKHIISVKKQENEVRAKAATTKAFKAKVAAIIAQKEDEQLTNMPIDQLKDLLKDSE